MKEMLTIIIPVYNSENTIMRSLESIISNNNYKHYEKQIKVLIIDDGSQDNSINIVKEYIAGRSNFKLITKKNSGAASTRNVGLELIKEGYIAFLDSDDLYDKDFFNTVFCNLKDDSLFIYNIEKIVYGNKKKKLLKLSNSIENITNEFLIKYLKDANYIAPSVVNKIYNANIINKEKIRFKNTLKYGEDLFFNLQYFQYIKNVIIEDKVLYYYFDNPNSTMNTVRLEDKKYFEILQQKLEKYLEQKQINTNVTYKMYFRNMIVILYSILKKQQSIIMKIKQCSLILNDEIIIEHINDIEKNELNIKRKIIYYIYKIKSLKKRRKK